MLTFGFQVQNLQVHDISMKQWTVDAIPFVVNSLASVAYIRPKIDAMYNQNRRVYYEEAKKSSYYDHHLFTSNDIEKEIYAKKMLGIFLVALLDRSIMDQIDKIIKKNWKQLYTYIIHGKDPYISNIKVIGSMSNVHIASNQETLIKSLNACMVMVSATQISQSNEELLVSAGIAFYVMVLHGKNVEFKGKGLMEEVAAMNVVATVHNAQQFERMHGFSVSDVTRERKNQLEELRRKLTIYSADKMNIEFMQEVMGLDEAQSFIQLVTAIAGQEDIDIFSQTLSNSTHEDIHFILNMLLDSPAGKNLDLETKDGILEAGTYLFKGLHIKNYFKMYKKLKQEYFENNAETNYFEIDSLEQQVANLKLELDKCSDLNRELQTKISNMNDTITSYKKAESSSVAPLQQTIKTLEKKVEVLEKQNEENMEELAVLRDFRHSLSSEDTENLDNTDVVLDHFNKGHGVIFGGAEQWQLRMKEFLPNFEFFYGDEDFDESAISNSDTIALYVNCKFKHGVYYKITNIARKQGKKLFYINNTNPLVALKILYHDIVQSKMPVG